MDAETYDYFLVQGGGERAIHLGQNDWIAIFDLEHKATYADALNAADDTRSIIMPLDGLIGVSEEPVPTISDVAAAHLADVDATTHKYAGRLEEMYNKQTAGDYSFHGVLACMLMELEGR